MTFDDFVRALSVLFDAINDEAKRVGGWNSLPGLRRLNGVWGGVLQPEEITQWEPVLDASTNRTYFYNTCTKESSWTPPKGVVEYQHQLKRQQQQITTTHSSTSSTRGRRSNCSSARVVLSSEVVLDRASTVLSLLFYAIQTAKSKSHKGEHSFSLAFILFLCFTFTVSLTLASPNLFGCTEYNRLLTLCVHTDMNMVVKRIQRKWKGRPNLLTILLAAAYQAKYQAWCASEQQWGALTIQCAYRRLMGRRISWKRICKRIYKFQVIEHDVVPPLYHPEAGPTVVARRSHFWYDKGRIGKSKSKHWTIPPILCHLGDVPIRVVDSDTVNPLCPFCKEDPQWQGFEEGFKVKTVEWHARHCFRCCKIVVPRIFSPRYFLSHLSHFFFLLIT